MELNDDLTNKDEFWSKFKHGVSQFKAKLPPNVLAVVVQDDFGDTSALLITMESEDKTYRGARTRPIASWTTTWTCCKAACAASPPWDA